MASLRGCPRTIHLGHAAHWVSYACVCELAQNGPQYPYWFAAMFGCRLLSVKSSAQYPASVNCIANEVVLEPIIRTAPPTAEMPGLILLATPDVEQDVPALPAQNRMLDAPLNVDSNAWKLTSVMLPTTCPVVPANICTVFATWRKGS